MQGMGCLLLPHSGGHLSVQWSRKSGNFTLTSIYSKTTISDVLKRSVRKFTCKNADHKWPHFLNVVVSYRACDDVMSYDRTPTFMFYLVDILSEQFASWTVCVSVSVLFAVSRKGWPTSCPCENLCFFMLWFDFIHRGLFILPYSIHNAHQMECFQNKSS